MLHGLFVVAELLVEIITSIPQRNLKQDYFSAGLSCSKHEKQYLLDYLVFSI